MVKARPENIDGQLGYAVALRGVKDYEKAAAAYDFVLSIDPKNEMAYNNAITLHEKYTKDFKKAQKMVEAYKVAFQGEIGVDHPIFKVEERIKQSQAEEEARIEAEKERQRRAEELKKEQMKKLEELKAHRGLQQEGRAGLLPRRSSRWA
ncbi:MAG: hypothetical protein H6740_25070 [Alphaproteobacteria bacterium]|nr:hypothetical protein [Alphaproteobacteria bacterium]